MAVTLQAVVFDLDGTVIDSHEAILACFRHTLAAHELAPVADAAVRELVGLPLLEMFERLVPGCDVDGLFETYRAAYWDLDAQHTRVFPGMVALVDALRGRGVRTAVATSKGRVGALRALASAGIADRFEVVGTNDCVARKKPAPDMLEHVLGQLDIAPGAAWMVGDTAYDVGMARSAGVRGCGVTWGAHDRERLIAGGAVAVADHVDELADLLR